MAFGIFFETLYLKTDLHCVQSLDDLRSFHLFHLSECPALPEMLFQLRISSRILEIILHRSQDCKHADAGCLIMQNLLYIPYTPGILVQTATLIFLTRSTGARVVSSDFS